MSRPLNILMICHQRRNRSRGRSQPLAKYMIQRGHQVSLIVVAEKRRFGIVESEWDGMRIIETPDLLWGRLRSGWDIWNLINRVLFLVKDRNAYDLIHCFETRPATIYPALTYQKRHKLPLLTDWNDWWGHGGLIETNRPRWYRFLFERIETYYEEAFRTSGSGLTVISTALARRAIKIGVPKEKICHLPGGVSTEFGEVGSKIECRKRVGLSLTEPILGYCGADQYLDIDIVMESLAIIARKYPTVKLIITGNAGRSVRELAHSYGVTNNIFLTGFLPAEQLPWYLGCSDVFVLPLADKIYNIGRWPNKIGLYMCLGRPTVTNPVGDIQSLLEQNDIGLLAKWDPCDFANKISCLLESPDLVDRLGENARRVAVTEYDWKVLIEKLESFYYQTVGTEEMVNWVEK